MNRISVFAFAFAACAASALADPPPTSSWKLTFNEEFDNPTLDASKWSNGYALGATGPGSWPDPANVKIDSGTLKLYGQKKSGMGKDFAGASITTRGKFSQMYGYFEARIKVPNGKGFSGKMTLTKSDGSYPPWLDLIETRGEEPNHPYWYLHQDNSSNTPGGGWNGTNMTTQFHTLGTEWNADQMIFYADGVQKLSDKTAAPNCRMAMCFSMELMVGGDTWIGIPDNSTPWPGVYEIDYVRVYQRVGPPTPIAPPTNKAALVRVRADASIGYLVSGRWWSGQADRSAASALCGREGCFIRPASIAAP